MNSTLDERVLEHDRYALQAFINLNGRNWRSKMRRLWDTYQDFGWQRRLRNTVGPTGLDRVSNEVIK